MQRTTQLLFIFLFIASSFYAQQGTIRGTIYDYTTGETLIGATVVKKGTTVGTSTDFDGKYSLNLDPGTYDLEIAFISYATKTVTGVDVKDGEVTLIDIRLSQELQTLEEVVIEAKAVRNTESAMVTMQKKSANLIEAISNQSFKKIGDRDAGAALKRVPGVTVQNGKYVFVRGLGDRYTKTILNSMPIPGLDPDKNAVQVDLFPTNLIDNIVVYKTFTPNLPGDFSGGIIDISTKDFPDRKTFNFSYGTSYNPEMNLNDEFILYEGGKTDLIGFDDGSRELPINPLRDIPDNTENNPLLTAMTSSFNPEMAAEKRDNFLNQNFGFSYGNQLIKGNATIGFNAMLNYNLTYKYYDDIEFGFYLKPAESNNNNLEKREVRTGELGRQNALWSSLLTGAVKFKNSSYVLNLFTTQNGISEASDRVASNFEQTSEILLEDVLTFTQRSMRNASLSGNHHFNKFDMEWKNSFSISRIYDPDFRITGLAVGTVGDTTLNPGAGGRIDRFFRDLNEWNESFKVDFTVPLNILEKKSKLKFGFYDSYKERDFEILQYNFKYKITSDSPDISGNPNWFFEEENIWNTNTLYGTHLVSSQIDSANIFEARQNVLAAYIMNEYPITNLFKAIYGVRAEQTNMFYTGRDQGSLNLDDEETLNELEILPSLNLVYQLGEKTNLRSSFNRTLARPSFKEKSVAQIFDPISKTTFIGNLNLNQTNINNFDLRLETFPDIGELLSVSLFYKQFDGHIEIVSFETAPDNVQPINSGSSQILGVEAEVKRNLKFISDSLNSFSYGGNVSFMKSGVKLDEVILPSIEESELEIRQQNAREDEIVDDTREMAGQAPFLINAYVNFVNRNSGIVANMSYNVQGKTLTIVGIGRVPDVYLAPFHSLNFKLSKTLGARKRSQLSLSVRNILDQNIRLFYDSFGSQEETYSFFREGRTFGLSYSYSFK